MQGQAFLLWSIEVLEMVFFAYRQQFLSLNRLGDSVNDSMDLACTRLSNTHPSKKNLAGQMAMELTALRALLNTRSDSWATVTLIIVCYQGQLCFITAYNNNNILGTPFFLCAIHGVAHKAQIQINKVSHIIIIIYMVKYRFDT